MYSRKLKNAKKSRRGGGRSEERKTTESWIDDQISSRERRRRIRSLRRRRWSASYFDRKSKEVAAHAASVAYSAMIDAVYAFQGCRQFVKRSQFSEKNEEEKDQASQEEAPPSEEGSALTDDERPQGLHYKARQQVLRS